ncbi:hypothetical protein AYO45_00315 [Gammaproteobacteria bacterium SCGC AG-212-F23]|nr:hypothetical protein AYO45_00315 [Gammaproteobacteria bacterium SCGC AG-212-F23]
MLVRRTQSSENEGAKSSTSLIDSVMSLFKPSAPPAEEFTEGDAILAAYAQYVEDQPGSVVPNSVITTSTDSTVTAPLLSDVSCSQPTAPTTMSIPLSYVPLDDSAEGEAPVSRVSAEDKQSTTTTADVTTVSATSVLNGELAAEATNSSLQSCVATNPSTTTSAIVIEPKVVAPVVNQPVVDIKSDSTKHKTRILPHIVSCNPQVILDVLFAEARENLYTKVIAYNSAGKVNRLFRKFLIYLALSEHPEKDPAVSYFKSPASEEDFQIKITKMSKMLRYNYQIYDAGYVSVEDKKKARSNKTSASVECIVCDSDYLALLFGNNLKQPLANADNVGEFDRIKPFPYRRPGFNQFLCELADKPHLCIDENNKNLAELLIQSIKNREQDKLIVSKLAQKGCIEALFYLAMQYADRVTTDAKTTAASLYLAVCFQLKNPAETDTLTRDVIDYMHATAWNYIISNNHLKHITQFAILLEQHPVDAVDFEICADVFRIIRTGLSVKGFEAELKAFENAIVNALQCTMFWDKRSMLTETDFLTKMAARTKAHKVAVPENVENTTVEVATAYQQMRHIYPELSELKLSSVASAPALTPNPKL